MDHSTTISSRAGSARLTAVLRQLMIFDEFEITDVPEGGFKARKSFRKAKEGGAFFGLSQLCVTPLGREVVVDADFGGVRAIRNFTLLVLTFLGALVFIGTSLDRETAGTPARYFSLLGWGLMMLLVWIVSRSLRKKADKMLERLLKGAVEIAELP